MAKPLLFAPGAVLTQKDVLSVGLSLPSPGEVGEGRGS